MSASPASSPAAPRPADWAALLAAAMALLARLSPATIKTLSRAAAVLKAKAVLLLFALAQTMTPAAGGLGAKPPAPPRLAGRRRRMEAPNQGAEKPPVWRNPSIAGHAFFCEESPLAPAPGLARKGLGKGGVDWGRRLQRALRTLAEVKALCADPNAYAARLAARLTRAAAAITRAEVQAFATVRQDEVRRDQELRRSLTWRGRRRLPDTG